MTDANAEAYARALGLACIEYPLAFGHTYKNFSISRAIHFFLNTTATLGIGSQHKLSAAVSVDHIDSDSVNLEFLFRHKDLRARGVGKFLLKSAFSYILESGGYQNVFLDTMSLNVKAESLYKSLGFEKAFTSKGADDVVVCMVLEGRPEIEKAKDNLQRSVV